LQHGAKYSQLKVTVLGDDLYCHQPLCELLLEQKFNFILTCLPTSHKTLYEHIEGVNLPTVIQKKWTGKVEETYIYRYSNGLPLKAGANALLVNWCELTVTRPNGKIVYKNSWATNHLITDEAVIEIVRAGRTRWKVEAGEQQSILSKPKAITSNIISDMESII
jgi:hypothetical protein